MLDFDNRHVKSQLKLPLLVLGLSVCVGFTFMDRSGVTVFASLMNRGGHFMTFMCSVSRQQWWQR